MNLGQIKEATCSPTVCAEKFMQFINETCDKYEINTPVRQLNFLAQVGHESGGLFYPEELASGAPIYDVYRLDLHSARKKNPNYVCVF
ncbi:MAG TPA: hypothetical protein VMY77_06990 [Chitinophagaceae bacterium]|nr:hypothetical protein [Chitinophagaceae bacterium]